MLPLLQVPGIRWFSLQLGKAKEDLDRLPQASQIVDLAGDLQDDADTAAVLSQLDLLLSVDTSTAHLAGAMGRPVWLVLPHVPDWRGGMNGERSPWYPTMRLWRQERPDDWEWLIGRMRNALEQWRDTGGQH